MMDNQGIKRARIDEILYGSFIQYTRLYEMTKYAFYGKSDANSVNIFIDVYSIIKSLFSRGLNITVDDYCVISSCMINLATHLRAYFETRHHVSSKIYIIYGGARPRHVLSQVPEYNSKNIFTEDSNIFMKELLVNDLDIMKLLCPYLYDIFCIVDYENEFSVISGFIIDMIRSRGNTDPCIIYSKDDFAYQLVATKSKTYLYRPKKKYTEDLSWVVTKSTLYDAYRYGELGLKKQIPCFFNIGLISLYQTIAGMRSRSLSSFKNANSTIKIIESGIVDGIIIDGYNGGTILSNHGMEIVCSLIRNFNGFSPEQVLNRFASIDLLNQISIFANTPNATEVIPNIVNLYAPDEVRAINNQYFQKYPLDLNRV